MRHLARIFALLLVPCSAALAQTPDRRGEVTLRQPEYQGAVANAPVPARYHVRNEGGSDGAGLCVISSVLCAGMYQGVPGMDVQGADGAAGKGSLLWRTAKSRRGGYSPDKLQRLLDEVAPGEKWASYVGRDTSILEKLSEKGYAIGSTMNTGSLYGYMPIHHMINLTHYKQGGLACVVDNNDPGKYHWMPATEYDRRWIDGGTGWAFIWTRLPVAAQISVGLIFALFLKAIAFTLIAVGKKVADSRHAACHFAS